MAGEFLATTEEMDQASRKVATVNGEVQSELTGLRERLAPLAGAWTGAAAIAFTRLMERWDTDARALNDALSSIGGAIGSSGVSYAQAEEQQAGAMSAIGAALNP